MASLKDVEQVADDLSGLVDQLRKEIQNGSFDKLTQLPIRSASTLTRRPERSAPSTKP